MNCFETFYFKLSVALIWRFKIHRTCQTLFFHYDIFIIIIYGTNIVLIAVFYSVRSNYTGLLAQPFNMLLAVMKNTTWAQSRKKLRSPENVLFVVIYMYFLVFCPNIIDLAIHTSLQQPTMHTAGLYTCAYLKQHSVPKKTRIF